MRLVLEVLDGPQKGQNIPLSVGLIIGQNLPYSFKDPSMAERHFVVDTDHKNTWNIQCLSENLIRVGTAEVNRISLLKGLIFNIGQTGFKVTERSKLNYESVDQGLKDFLDHQNPTLASRDFFFFLKPIRLTFVQGLQLGEFYTLSYGPRILGHNNLDLNIKDPGAPLLAARFFQIADQAYVENLSNDRIKLNGKSFLDLPISDGDLLTVGSDVMELNIL